MCWLISARAGIPAAIHVPFSDAWCHSSTGETCFGGRQQGCLVGHEDPKQLEFLQFQYGTKPGLYGSVDSGLKIRIHEKQEQKPSYSKKHQINFLYHSQMDVI